MDAIKQLDGLGFPEGPIVMPDRAIVFCDGNTGELRRWADQSLTTYAHTGGSPWGAALGSDGCVYVAQAGSGIVDGGTTTPVCIQRVTREARVNVILTSAGDDLLAAPNDLAFGPDGRLCFTDSGTELEHDAARRSSGKLFAVDRHRGERLMERAMACPNGIAFDETGRMYWTESLARRVCRLAKGRVEVFATFSEPYVPDGMAFARDGRLFVCTTTSRSVTILGTDGSVIGEILIGAYPTNCVFAGATLFITATMTAEICGAERTGTLWSAEINGTGLPLLQGRL